MMMMIVVLWWLMMTTVEMLMNVKMFCVFVSAFSVEFEVFERKRASCSEGNRVGVDRSDLTWIVTITFEICHNRNSWTRVRNQKRKKIDCFCRREEIPFDGELRTIRFVGFRNFGIKIRGEFDAI